MPEQEKARRWTLVGRIVGAPGMQAPRVEVVGDGPVIPELQKVEPENYFAGTQTPWPTETYIPESALLSEEVKAAIYEADRRYQNVDPREQSEDGWLTALLEAAIAAAKGET